MLNTPRRPQYHVARCLLTVATLAGVLGIVGGSILLAGAYTAGTGMAPMAIGAGLVMNGLLVVAGAQMGSAALDTAVSTRETADAVTALLAQREVREAEPRAASGLRATR